MPRSPAIRISVVRDMADFLDEFKPGARARVLKRVPAPTLEVLHTGPRTEWLSIEHGHHIVDAIVAELGPTQAIRCWEESMTSHVGKPLLRSFAEGMLRLLGHNPMRVLGLLPVAWPLVYRDFCTPMLVPGATEVALSDSPTSRLRFSAILITSSAGGPLPRASARHQSEG